MYRVLALDLDGTVLNSHHKISKPLLDTIRSLSDRATVLIVTGRHHTAAKPYYFDLGLDAPAICCNGTYLYDYHAEKVIQENSIPHETAKAFLELAEAQGLNIVMYARDAMLYSETNPIVYMEELEEWSKQYEGKLKPDIRKVKSFRNELENSEYIWKFVVQGDDLYDFASNPLVKEEFSGERSWINRMDFSYKGNSKGNALSEMVASLGCQPEDVVAIGDNHNDISMLEYAGLGVAMSGSDLSVINAAQVVTTENNDSERCLANLIRALF